MAKQFMLDSLLGHIADHMTYQVMTLVDHYGYHESPRFNIHFFWLPASGLLQWHEIHSLWKMELFAHMGQSLQPADLQMCPKIFKQAQLGLHDQFKRHLQALCHMAMTDL